MFTQPCFIRKNNKELQDVVYTLGGRSGKIIWDCEFHTLLVADNNYFRCYDDEQGNDKLLINIGFIDCGTNENLFLALAALRDDSDKFQWFTDGYNWVFCDSNKFGSYWAESDIEINLNAIHKATTQELIEHFKHEG